MGEELKQTEIVEPNWKEECQRLADMVNHLNDENYNLKMAVRHLSDVIINEYKTTAN